MENHDDLNVYDIHSNFNPFIVNYNYNPHDSDVIESIDVLFTDDEYEYEYEYEEEEAQRMSIEAINLTQEMMNEQPRHMANEMINSYLRDGDELIEICSVCLDDVVNIESTSKLRCGHHFHTNCITSCLERNNKCPLCRQCCLIN
jgi:hypothetical protein